MHEFGITMLIKDAVRIMDEAGTIEQLDDGRVQLSCRDSERLHAIHDELVALECDDVALIGKIARYLMACYGGHLH